MIHAEDKRWQQIEGALALVACVILYVVLLGIFPWWAAILIFFAPDLTFAAYLAGPKVGSVVYNSLHNYGCGAVLVCIGAVFVIPALTAIGLLWVAHCGFDRMMGYGLKRSDAFTSTHMGDLG